MYSAFRNTPEKDVFELGIYRKRRTRCKIKSPQKSERLAWGLVPYLCPFGASSANPFYWSSRPSVLKLALLFPWISVYFAVLHFEIRLRRTTTTASVTGPGLCARVPLPNVWAVQTFFITAACWCWLNPKGWSHLGWCNATTAAVAAGAPCVSSRVSVFQFRYLINSLMPSLNSLWGAARMRRTAEYQTGEMTKGRVSHTPNLPVRK